MARAPRAKAKPTPKAKAKAKRPPHRPRHSGPPLSDEVQRELVGLARDGAIDAMLAAAAGVAHNTFAAWRGHADDARAARAEGRPTDREGFADFFDRIDRAREAADLDLVRAVRRAAQGDEHGEGADWRAAKYLLSCRHLELSERRIADREAAARAEAVEMAKLRAAVRIQEEIAEKQAAAAEDGQVVTQLPPDAQILAAQIVRALMDPKQAEVLRAALAQSAP